MPKTIYSSYTQAKQVLERLNSLSPDSNQATIDEVKKLVEDFFTKNLVFGQFCSNLYGKTFEPDSLKIFDDPATLTLENLDSFRQPILAFILNAASQGGITPTIDKNQLDELVKGFQASQVVKNSNSLEETKTEILGFPDENRIVKNWVQNQIAARQAEIAKNQQAHQQLVRNLQAQILKTRNKEVLQGIKKLNPSQTPTNAVQNVSAAAEEVAREIAHSIGEHLQAGGKINNPLLKQALKTQAKQNIPAAVLFKNKELENTIDQAVNYVSQNQQGFLAACQASKTNAPTPNDIVEELQKKLGVNKADATDILIDIQAKLATEKITVRQAIFEILPQKITDTQENLLKLTNELSPPIQSHVQAAIRLLPKEKFSQKFADYWSEVTKKINALNPKDVIDFFTTIEFSHLSQAGQPIENLSTLFENYSFSGQPPSKNLAHKIESLKQLPDLVKRLPQEQGITFRFLKKLPTPSFLQKPISIVQNFGGTLGRIPGLKGFGGFLQKFTPSTIKTKAIGSLLSFGAKQAAKKGLMGLLGKGATWLGTKLAGKGISALIGTAIGGPVGTVAGVVISIAAEKVLGKILNKKNLKKLAKILGGALLFIGGLIGGLLSALGGIALGGLGIGMIAAGILIPTPLSPFLIAGGAGLTAASLWKSVIQPALTKAGSALQAGIQPFLHSLATGWGGAAIPSYIALSPAIAVAATAGITLISYMTLISAFAIPPSGAEIGMPITAGNRVPHPDSDHPAVLIAKTIDQYDPNSLVSQNSWSKELENALKNIAPKGYQEIRHSVWKIAGNSNLQCVGFKIAVEKELGINMPRQNAVAFLYNYPAQCREVSASQAQVGDDAVWGPDPEKCPVNNYQAANEECGSNIYCCGHIGIVAGVKGNVKLLITSAHGENGAVYTEEVSRDNPTMVLRCEK